MMKRLFAKIVKRDDDAKQKCQDWNEIECKDCDSLSECELIDS